MFPAACTPLVDVIGRGSEVCTIPRTMSDVYLSPLNRSNTVFASSCCCCCSLGVASYPTHQEPIHQETYSIQYPCIFLMFDVEYALPTVMIGYIFSLACYHISHIIRILRLFVFCSPEHTAAAPSCPFLPCPTQHWTKGLFRFFSHQQRSLIATR